MIQFKTAVLLSASLKIGAILADASEKDQNHLYEFGLNIGLAFQLKDDLLDVFGKQDTFGKQLGGDIFANEKTFLYLKAFQLGDDSIKEKLEILYNNNDTSFAKVKEVTDIFKTLDIQKHTVDMMKSYYIKGMKHLDDIDSDVLSCESVSLSQRECEIITLIAEGFTNTKIAKLLFLSPHTISTHRKNIMLKLGVKNTAGIVMYAVKTNLISPNKFLFKNIIQ